MIAVHIGTSEVRVAVVDLVGTVLSERRYDYLGISPPEVVALIAHAHVQTGMDVPTGAKVIGTGVSIGGWVDSGSGDVVSFAPLGWVDIPFRGLVVAALPGPVEFDQMVRGMAIAERMFGAASGCPDFVELYVGNVVGSAIHVGGRVQTGMRGAAGTISHIPVPGRTGLRCDCGRLDCLQSVASDLAVLDRAQHARTDVDLDSIGDVVRAAEAGDVVIAGLLEDRAGILGAAAAVVIDLLNPALLVLAGTPTRAPSSLTAFSAALNRTGEHLVGERTELRFSAFGDAAPTLASAAVILDSYYRDPLQFETA